jgi:hypothetical protein
MADVVFSPAGVEALDQGCDGWDRGFAGACPDRAQPLRGHRVSGMPVRQARFLYPVSELLLNQ